MNYKFWLHFIVEYDDCLDELQIPITL